MFNYNLNLIKIINRRLFAGFILLMIFTCPFSWASQEAIVIAEKAVIYSSIEMNAPIGFVRRGKSIKVGDIARNHARVYPIIIAKKVAYIRAKDISFDVDGEKKFVATRFYDIAKEDLRTHVSFGVLNYSTQYQSPINGAESDFSWFGYSLKGEHIMKNRWGLQVFTNGLWGTKNEEQFRSIELGMGGSYTIFDFGRLKMNLFAQMWWVPFANYSVGSSVRVNGHGLGYGAGVASTMDIGKRWGIEGSLGIFNTSLSGFVVPEEYTAPEPTFTGARLVLSAYYRF